MNQDFDPRELTEEKSLYEIFKKALRMQGNRFNGLVILCATLGLAGQAYFSCEKASAIVVKIHWITDIGISTSTSVLGFLVAGFTIFATITDKALFVYMAKVKHPHYSFSYFKYSLFAFMYVFIMYIAFLIACLFCRLFFDSNSVIPVLLRENKLYTPQLKLYGLKSLYSIMFVWLMYLILLLKTFVFNMYHVVTVSVRWEIENRKT